MKHLRIILALTLALVLLCGCGASVSVEELAGEWSMDIPCDQEDATYLLDMMDLYAEERTVVDLGSMKNVLIARFGADGSYIFLCDAEANKACVRAFYDGVMDDLFENRAELTNLYGEEVVAMTREEFNSFYADAYGVASYEFLMTRLVDDAYDYEALSAPIEEGTFKIMGSNLMCTPTGDGEAGTIGVKLDGDTLTLTYSDGDEVYTRVK